MGHGKYIGTCVSLGKQLGILVSTLTSIVKTCSIIKQNANQCGPMTKKKKYIKKSRLEEQEHALKEWFENARSSNLQVSDVVLREKAMHISKNYKLMILLHHLVYKTMCGKSSSVDAETADE
jgi:hypothetical protein